MISINVMCYGKNNSESGLESERVRWGEEKIGGSWKPFLTLLSVITSKP